MTQTQSLKIINIPSALNAKTVIEVIAKLNVFMKSSDIRVVIDFSETVFAAPSGLTPLLCYLRDIPRYKDKFRGLIVHSNNEQTDKLIEQMGFYNLLGISDNYEWDRDSTELFKELYCFSTRTPENEVIEINEKIIYAFTKLSPNDNYKKAVSWCIPELVDNARTHSHSNECVLFAQKHSRGDYTEFCIADRGVGIQATMGDNDIISALKRCISPEKGINSQGMGNGLYFTSELIKHDNSGPKSSLAILSGNAILRITSGSDYPDVQKINSFWNGTVVTLTLSDNIQSSIENIKNSEVTLTEDLPNFYY